MSESVLEQSLQFASQETTAVVLGAAVLVGALSIAIIGIRRRGLVGSGRGAPATTGEPISDGGTTVVPADPERSEKGGSETADRDRTETPDTEELDGRLDDLEGDVEALSTAVRAVHNENEEISESVQDIEENTGRLLNLYKMATRGVNPFDGGTDGGARPTAGDSETVEKETETIETDVADPDAEALFSGSDGDGPEIREEHCVDSVEEVVETETEPADAFQRRAQSESEDSGVEEIATEDEPATEETGRESLDDELEPETVAEWFGNVDDPTEEPPESLGTEETIEAPSGSLGSAASDGGVLIEDNGPAAPAEPDGLTEEPQGAEFENPGETEAVTPDGETEAVTPDVETETESPDPPAETAMPDPETETAAAPEVETPATPGGHAATEGKPYIESLPEGFGAEVITVEWLEYLIDEVGVHETVRAIHYYETIDWLTEEAVAELDAYLDGFDDGEGGTLSVDHHRRSLNYVEELTATDGPGHDGPEGSE